MHVWTVELRITAPTMQLPLRYCACALVGATRLPTSIEAFFVIVRVRGRRRH